MMRNSYEEPISENRRRWETFSKGAVIQRLLGKVVLDPFMGVGSSALAALECRVEEL